MLHNLVVLTIFEEFFNMKIICDWENCDQIGSYKAPLEKDNSKKHRLLCLEHIKIFNKKWNYFSILS